MSSLGRGRAALAAALCLLEPLGREDGINSGWQDPPRVAALWGCPPAVRIPAAPAGAAGWSQQVVLQLGCEALASRVGAGLGEELVARDTRL